MNIKEYNIKNDTLVSIVIVNYRTFDLLKKCILSIIQNTQKDRYEIVVVDNSNQEDEFAKIDNFARELTIPFKLINAEANLGFGKANNLGVKYTDGQYILLLNSDTLLLNDIIDAFLSFDLDSHCCGVLGPNVYTLDKKPNYSFSPYKIKPSFVKKGSSFASILFNKVFKKNPYFNSSGKEKRIKGYLTGACMFLKKDLYQSIGGFNEDIFMYSEDLLLCCDIVKQGKTIWNTPKAKIIHLEGASSERELSDFKAKNIAHGAFVFANSYFKKQRDKNRYFKNLIRIEKRIARINTLNGKVLEKNNHLKQSCFYQEEFFK